VYQTHLSRLRGPVDLALRLSPAQAVCRWRSGGKLAILAYHGVPDPETFAAQLDYLRRSTNPISPDDLRAALRRRAALSRRAVLVTFDDADRSLLENGLPLLRERGIPAAAFVVAGVLDSDEPFWFDEVRALIAAGVQSTELAGSTADQAVRKLKRIPDHERRVLVDQLRESAGPTIGRIRRPQLRSEDLATLEQAGIAIGNHSLTHPILTRCDDATLDVEIFEAHRRLTQVLGHEPVAFVCPNGDRDARVMERVAGAGYDLGFVFDHRLSDWPPPDPLVISRLRGSASDSVHRLAISVSGLHPAVHRLRSRG